MFRRGQTNAELFGAPVILPSSEDLFAHLLLHATLHWLNLGRLHRPQDFESVGQALTLNVDQCARHLSEQGLLPHAWLMLPLITHDAGGEFVDALASRLSAPPRARAATWLVRTLAARYPRPGHAARRLAGLALAPSLSSALATALRDRMRPPRPV